MVIGLFPNTGKEHTAAILQRTVGFLQAAGIDFLLPETEGRAFGFEECCRPETELPGLIDCAISFGGDGTTVKCARLLAGTLVPLCGVNLGRVGFLNDVAADNLEQALADLNAGRYKTAERMMLEAQVLRNGETAFKGVALNDAVIAKSGLSRLLRLSVSAKDGLIETYPADGVIIATPTGSTGYSLSANGPIIHPEVRALIVTPICPHLLHSRSVVLSGDEVVTVTYYPARAEAILTLDGQTDFRLEHKDQVMLSELSGGVKFVKFDNGKSFFETVREKLHVR